MNTITMTGNLTDSKAGIRSTENSQVVNRAIGENGKNKKTQFTDIEAWGDVATNLQTFAKGEYVTVTGFLKHGEYAAQDGSKRRTVRIVVQSVVKAERKAQAAAE